MTQKVKPSTLADTSVTASTYGGSSSIPVFTVDAQGRLTYAANATPSIATSQLTGTINAGQVANNQTYGINITGSANTSSQLTANSWIVSVSGTKLIFSYNGTTVLSLNSNGALISANSITQLGTP